MNVVVKKAAIVSSLFLKYEFEQVSLSSTDNIKVSADAPIHEDLRQAFRALIPHFAFVCEQVTDQKLVERCITNPEDYLMDKDSSEDTTFFNFRVAEVTIKGVEDDERVVISGARRLENTSAEIHITAPEIRLGDAKYPFSDDLESAVKTLRSEVEAYMQGKHAEPAQLEMFGDSDDLEDQEL